MLRLMLTFLQRQGLSTMALHCLDTRATTQSSFTRRNDNILSNISPGRAIVGSDPVMAAVTDMVRANTGASRAGGDREAVSGYTGYTYVGGSSTGYLCTGPRPAWLAEYVLASLPSPRHCYGSTPLPCFQSLF